MSTGPMKLGITGEQNMHCGGSSSAVEALLSEVGRIQEVRADHNTRRAQIKFEPRATPLQPILEALAKPGYQADPAR